MDEGAHSGADNAFETIDPKLNMFALANGMDLLKSEASRRLVWFMGGLERGLEITATGDGFAVQALSWPTRRPEEATTTAVSDGVEPSELSATLEQGIEVANGL